MGVLQTCDKRFLIICLVSTYFVLLASGGRWPWPVQTESEIHPGEWRHWSRNDLHWGGERSYHIEHNCKNIFKVTEIELIR